AKFMQALMLIIGVIGVTVLIVIRSRLFPGSDANKLKQFNVAAISPGGNYIASANSNGRIIVQDTQNKQEYPIDNNAPIKSVAISSDGNYIVTGNEKGNVELWDVTSKKKIEINSNNNLKHEKAVLSVDINALQNNKIKIVSGGADGKALLWTVRVINGNGEATIDEL
ncbi:MAG: hypothetical protein AAFW70_22865, partial [Cyanobacteria bacterium J06635_10]